MCYHQRKHGANFGFKGSILFVHMLSGHASRVEMSDVMRGTYLTNNTPLLHPNLCSAVCAEVELLEHSHSECEYRHTS